MYSQTLDLGPQIDCSSHNKIRVPITILTPQVQEYDVSVVSLNKFPSISKSNVLPASNVGITLSLPQLRVSQIWMLKVMSSKVPGFPDYLPAKVKSIPSTNANLPSANRIFRSQESGSCTSIFSNLENHTFWISEENQELDPCSLNGKPLGF